MTPLVAPLLEIGSKVIDRLWPDPEQREKAKLELLRLQQAGELRDLEVRMSAILAEAKSKDPWTSRARPSFLYVMYAVIGLCFAGGILGIWWPDNVAAAAGNIAHLLGAIPDQLWWLFGAGYLGYTGARSYDKRNLVKLKEARSSAETLFLEPAGRG